MGNSWAGWGKWIRCSFSTLRRHIWIFLFFNRHAQFASSPPSRFLCWIIFLFPNFVYLFIFYFFCALYHFPPPLSFLTLSCDCLIVGGWAFNIFWMEGALNWKIKDRLIRWGWAQRATVWTWWNESSITKWFGLSMKWWICYKNVCMRLDSRWWVDGSSTTV